MEDLATAGYGAGGGVLGGLSSLFGCPSHWLHRPAQHQVSDGWMDSSAGGVITAGYIRSTGGVITAGYIRSTGGAIVAECIRSTGGAIVAECIRSAGGVISAGYKWWRYVYTHNVQVLDRVSDTGLS